MICSGIEQRWSFFNSITRLCIAYDYFILIYLVESETTVQQDGASPHCSGRTVFGRTFSNVLDRQQTPVQWPDHLTPHQWISFYGDTWSRMFTPSLFRLIYFLLIYDIYFLENEWINFENICRGNRVIKVFRCSRENNP